MSSRDEFSPAVKAALAKRVGYRCSNPTCRQPTSGPTLDTAKGVNVGVAAHITAAAGGGPRHERTLSAEMRRSAENGVWLCQKCAKLVDSDTDRYTAQILQAWKQLAEHVALAELESRPRQVAAVASPVPEQQPVSWEMLQVSELAETDCKVLGIQAASIVDFVVGEATRHPILFRSSFSSIPLVFGNNVLLLSWDGTKAKIERVLNRQEAYPLNDAWTSCLAAYRRATLLPYRTKGRESFLISSELKRALGVYRRLMTEVRSFLNALIEQGVRPSNAYLDLEPLMREAEFALANDNNGMCIARMEVVLSTTHKLILQFAPQGPLSEPQSAPPIAGTGIAPQGLEPQLAPQRPSAGLGRTNTVTVLIVDDDERDSKVLLRHLAESGCFIVVARTTSEALRAIVERDFDIVVTDLLMAPEPDKLPQLDGREVALAAKRSSSKTRVVVFTAFSEMSRMADIINDGVDDIISKMDPFGVDRIKRLIEGATG